MHRIVEWLECELKMYNNLIQICIVQNDTLLPRKFSSKIFNLMNTNNH